MYRWSLCVRGEIHAYCVVSSVPGSLMLIWPAHWQLQTESSVRGFLPPIEETPEPGDHGAVMTGIQGWGVSAPCAAAVAAATCGFASD